MRRDKNVRGGVCESRIVPVFGRKIQLRNLEECRILFSGLSTSQLLTTAVNNPTSNSPTAQDRGSQERVYIGGIDNDEVRISQSR